MGAFKTELRLQRWDDHRYYHHSRINQTLHLISAMTFVAAYVILFFDPPLAALLGWLVAMTTRQSGHFFFEPRGFDHINKATHAYKEEVKVGYNLFRKWVLMGVWAGLPLLLLLDPSFLGLLTPHVDAMSWVRNVGWLWLGLAVAGLVFRTMQLFVIRDALTGLAWATKILTDPFNDIRLYRKAPIRLLRKEFIDPLYFAQVEVYPSTIEAEAGA